jgi:hypothetical protein
MKVMKVIKKILENFGNINKIDRALSRLTEKPFWKIVWEA